MTPGGGQNLQCNRHSLRAASRWWLVASFTISAMIVQSSQSEADDADAADTASTDIPQPLTDEHFADLKENSPFLRSLDHSKTLVLTGVASVNGELVATIFDRESQQTRVVSRTANEQKWQLIDVEGDRQHLEAMTAQVSVAGGEVVSVRFDPAQLKVQARSSGPQIPADQAAYIAEQARNFRDGIRGDGVRGPPAPEVVEKLSKLTEQQRGQVIYQIRQMRDNGASSEDRQATILRLADQALRGTR